VGHAALVPICAGYYFLLSWAGWMRSCAAHQHRPRTTLACYSPSSRRGFTCLLFFSAFNIGFVLCLCFAVVPSTRVVSLKGKELQYGFQNFVASTGSVVGDVKIGELTSLWYGTTVRGELTSFPPGPTTFDVLEVRYLFSFPFVVAGDQHSVVLGRSVAVMDNAVIGSSKAAPTKIGNDVVIMPNATIQGATEIGDGVTIGSGAVVMSGARIGPDCFIDAGAIVTSNTVVPAGTLWTGSPARQLRALKADEMSYLRSTAVSYATLSQRHYEQSLKTPEELEAELEKKYLRRELRLKEDAPLPELDPDVVQYYKLTAIPDDKAGLLRGKEYDIQAEFALREAEEVAADAEENAAYDHAARLKRVGATLKAIAAAKADRPAQRAKALAELASRDPEGAALLRDLLARVTEAAAAPSDATGSSKARLLDSLMRIDPQANFYSDEKEAKDAAEKIFTACVGFAKEVGALTGGAESAGAVSGAAAAGSAAPSSKQLA
jgi:gamma-carbonic anhydrase